MVDLVARLVSQARKFLTKLKTATLTSARANTTQPLGPYKHELFANLNIKPLRQIRPEDIAPNCSFFPVLVYRHGQWQ